MKTTMKWSWFLGIILIISCSNQDENKTQIARFVKTEKVVSIANIKELVFNGVITEDNQSILSFRVGGPLQELKVDIGSYVQTGELVAKIDQRDFLNHLESARVKFLHAKSEYERYNELYKRNKIPENTVEKLETNYRLAKTAFEKAENALTDTELKAPFSGYIFKKYTENFNTVAPGQPVVSIVDINHLEVVINVPASLLKELHLYANFSCVVADADAQNIKAKLKDVSQKAGRDNLYEVRFGLENIGGNAIRPGMNAMLTLTKSKEDSNTCIVPVNSVFNIGGENFVWIYNPENSKVMKRKVHGANISPHGYIAVESGIQNGEYVITAGIQSLFEGQQVRPLKEKSKSNEGGLM